MTKKDAISFYGKETIKLAEVVFKGRFGKSLFARGQNIYQQRKFIENARKLIKLDKKELNRVLLELSKYY